ALPGLGLRARRDRVEGRPAPEPGRHRPVRRMPRRQPLARLLRRGRTDRAARLGRAHAPRRCLVTTNAIDRAAANPAMPAPTFVTQATAVEQARAVAEVAAAVQVAQMNPRDMNRAWAEMRAACDRLGLAEQAFYKVPNRGTGPSVHLARELARIWGNLDYGVHELSRDDVRAMSEVRAFAWDQQTNVRSSRTFQVPHQRMVKE